MRISNKICIEKKKQDVLEILQNQRKILQSYINYYLNHLSHFQRIT